MKFAMCPSAKTHLRVHAPLFGKHCTADYTYLQKNINHLIIITILFYGFFFTTLRMEFFRYRDVTEFPVVSLVGFVGLLP